MAKGLFFGLTTVDIIYGTQGGHPVPNQKMRADRQAVFAGGPAANSAVAFAVLGNESLLYSGLGEHPLAQSALADLSEHKVVFRDLSGDKNALPVISSILVNLDNGDRTVIYCSSGRRHLLLRDIDVPVLLQGVDVILLDGFYLEQAVMVAEEARKQGIKTVLDGGSWKEGLENLLPYIDYAICSADFYPPGCQTDHAVLAALADLGIEHCAISRGDMPVAYVEPGKVGELAVPDVKVVDTLGAGDILHGTFCHNIVERSFVESLELSIAVAAQSCRYFGTRTWIQKMGVSGGDDQD